MFKSKKVLLLLSLILVFALVAVGCSSPEAPAGGEEVVEGEVTESKTVLVVGQGADAVSLDPHATNDQPSSRVSKQIYDTLVEQDQNMALQPGLATSWEEIDELTFEFTLKQGVVFHNGEAFTANDVKFTLLRALESTHIGHIVGQIDPEGIEIIDDHTIRISTTEPFAPLLAHLAHTATAMLNETAVTEAGEDYGQHPIGTGPFVFDKWNTGDSIELLRNDNYHGEAPKIEKVIMRSITENANRTIELETGQIDIAYDISPNDVNRVEAHDDLILLRQPNFSTAYVGFNVAKEPYNDVRVRQAINYAVDMEAIVEAVYQGVGAPAKGPLGPNVWASNQSLEEYGFDQEKAKELLAEAGYPEGFKTTLWTNQNQQREDIATIVANQLGQIGIEAEISVVEWGTYLEDTAAGKHDMLIMGWTTVTGDPDYGLYSLFHSKSTGTAGNRSFYGNDRVDELLDLGRRSADPVEREAYYMEAQVIIRDEAPWIFTWSGEDLNGTQSDVRGFVPHPAGHHKLHGVYFE
ncbi:extracellular solute-binding protein, family 5 [Alkaliphilus metalliredigens QYMF]|uniref:Extracellular solute-binding protein, family 5 n=1 Tax=Alkaliphilus metalliredigens (strain QYMF) TaxID=293826 RepID=A6TS91_ALKMQ|nr:glutathione ABC transporter substrate-binding protein [Alkaliphilus metalliredigens]ABR49059.1 extracellular solute-binding protein, family 5 [Alkaliphilus metalliredigens QYMF]